MWKGNGNLYCKSMELFFEVYDNKECTQVKKFKYSNNLNIKPYKEDFMYILKAYLCFSRFWVRLENIYVYRDFWVN